MASLEHGVLTSIGHGPGFFPRWLGLLLTGLSVSWLLSAVWRSTSATERRFFPEWRGLRRSLLVKSALQRFAAERGVPTFRQFVFETSGSAAGQSTAFGLLGPGGYLSIVGFTAAKLELRLSNLMAFDATVQGNWACLPELYPDVLDLVLTGRIALAPFLVQRPLGEINEVFAELHARPAARRIVLVPENRP